MSVDPRTHASRLRSRDTRAQIFAGVGMGLCVVALMAIVMGSM